MMTTGSLSSTIEFLRDSKMTEFEARTGSTSLSESIEQSEREDRTIEVIVDDLDSAFCDLLVDYDDEIDSTLAYTRFGDDEFRRMDVWCGDKWRIELMVPRTID